MNNLPPVITIDGPSGSGKGVLSKKLANILRWNVLDSGIIYRVLALIALNNRININNELKLAELANSIRIDFVNKLNGFLVFCNNRKITQDVYTEYIGNVASKIALFPKVRAILLEYQRTFRIFPGLIADGRDMGTIVFPNAVLKIFLYASFEERKRRRLYQLQKKSFNVNFNYATAQMITERDKRDYNRKLAPLFPAANALVLDSTHLSQNEIKVKVCTYIKENLLFPSEILCNKHS